MKFKQKGHCKQDFAVHSIDKCKGTVLNACTLPEADVSQCTAGKFCQAPVAAFAMCFAKEQKTA